MNTDKTVFFLIFGLQVVSVLKFISILWGGRWHCFVTLSFYNGLRLRKQSIFCIIMNQSDKTDTLILLGWLSHAYN